MFSQPEENLLNINLHSGQIVADLGSGSGFHAIAAAKHMGETGTVYAVEIQKNLLNTIESRAKEAGLTNVKVIWGDIDEPNGIKLGDAICDVVLMANVFFQVEEKNICTKEAARILKKGGTLLLIEWKDSFNNLGPHKDSVVTSQVAKPYFINAGFEVAREFDAGHHHYGVIFKKK